VAVAVFTGRLAPAQEAAEPSEPVAPVETFKPRGNSEFISKQTVARITRRFEMYDPHSVEALQTLKEMGFTQVVLDWPNLHGDATEIGLDVVLANWWTDKTKPEEIDRGIELARQVDPARLAGISVMDEPELNAPETPFSFYVDLYERLRQQLARELPGVRLEISHAGPHASWDQRYYDHFSALYEAADVMRIMPFPDLNEGPLSNVYFMILRSRELMRIAGRQLPLVVILQTWVLPPESKLPEMAELRVMAWQAMLAGAETLSFFDYNPEVWSQTPGFHDQFAELMQELTSVRDRRGTPRSDPGWTPRACCTLNPLAERPRRIHHDQHQPDQRLQSGPARSCRNTGLPIPGRDVPTSVYAETDAAVRPLQNCPTSRSHAMRPVPRR
jgi:hypothetical protein